MPHPPSADDLDFALATGLRPQADGATFDTAIHPLWTVGDKPNGGYLLALLGGAACQVAAGLAAGAKTAGAEAPGPDVVSAAVTYLRPPDLGPATIRTTVLRQGRTAHHVRGVLVQDGADLVDAVFVTGEVPPAGPARYDAVRPLHIPAPEDCVRLPAQVPGGVRVGIMEATELRLDPATLPFAPRPPSDGSPVAELRGWVRFADGRA
ncbi:MAG TPA: acyl-CoA thioesterase domain-containing protein, partial [Acidimicrobiales bacterium]|nr:acyl-CoA thioesterase domain-containing protein [Acidimicrobiales bacterium]